MVIVRTMLRTMPMVVVISNHNHPTTRVVSKIKTEQVARIFQHHTYHKKLSCGKRVERQQSRPFNIIDFTQLKNKAHEYRFV
jgi:hypothetical protein